MSPFEHGYEVDDPVSSEREVREFLHSLVRVMKPALVVETGCYVGRTTETLVSALVENGRGKVVSCDTEFSNVNAACWQLRRYWSTCGVWDVRLCRGEDIPEIHEADLVFLDSDYAARRREFELVKPGTLVVVHDTRISYDSEVPPHETWVRELGGILFETHRGFGMLRK